MFQVGDVIAHPMHGAGVIAEIETRKIGGASRDYYVLRLPVGGMEVLIPTETCEAIGVRSIVDEAEADRIIASIPDMEISEDSNWNKRYRDNMYKIKSGNLMHVASVIKSLVLRDADKGLSTGERKMLHSAKLILVSELSLSKHAASEEIESLILEAIRPGLSESAL